MDRQNSTGGSSLKEISRAYKIPVRKLVYLIRTGALEGVLENGTISISHKDISDYLDLPKEVRTKNHASYLKTLGPGLITGASDDDPSGIGTYSSVGAVYGLALSWLALYLLPMMTAVQEAVARIGIVTQHGLASVIRKRYGKRVLIPLVAILLIANTINIGADIGAMAASFQLIAPVDFAPTLIVLTIGIALLETFIPYHRYSKILKWLTLSLLAYIITGFIIKPDWLAVASSLTIPHIEFNTSFIAAMVAVMGTTITPYLFFWQASEEVEEEGERGTLGDFHTQVIATELSEMRKDTYSGMLIANIVFLFVIITTAFVLHDNGITSVDSAATAALALKPLAGNFASVLFTIGIFGVGLLAVPVLAGSSAYALSELVNWEEGLQKKPRSAKGFYLIIILSMAVGLLLNFIGITPIRALYYAAILNGIAAPILMFFIFRISADEKVMGPFTGTPLLKFIGWFATLLMGVSAVVLIVMMALGL